MLLGISRLAWWGEGTPRGPWADPTEPPSLSYSAAALGRSTIHYRDDGGEENTSFFRHLAGASAGQLQGYVSAVMAVTDLQLISYGSHVTHLCTGAPAPAPLDLTHPYAAVEHRFRFTHTVTGSGDPAIVIAPGIKAMYLEIDALGRVIVHLADVDIVNLQAAAAVVLINNVGDPVTGLSRGELMGS